MNIIIGLVLVSVFAVSVWLFHTGLRSTNKLVKVVDMPPPAQLAKMSKAKLDEWAKENGIELDRRQTKANMIAELEKKR